MDAKDKSFIAHLFCIKCTIYLDLKIFVYINIYVYINIWLGLKCKYSVILMVFIVICKYYSITIFYYSLFKFSRDI
jgi:hypothetical protein